MSDLKQVVWIRGLLPWTALLLSLWTGRRGERWPPRHCAQKATTSCKKSMSQILIIPWTQPWDTHTHTKPHKHAHVYNTVSLNCWKANSNTHLCWCFTLEGHRELNRRSPGGRWRSWIQHALVTLSTTKKTGWKKRTQINDTRALNGHFVFQEKIGFYFYKARP